MSGGSATCSGPSTGTPVRSSGRCDEPSPTNDVGLCVVALTASEALQRLSVLYTFGRELMTRSHLHMRLVLNDVAMGWWADWPQPHLASSAFSAVNSRQAATVKLRVTAGRMM